MPRYFTVTLICQFHWVQLLFISDVLQPFNRNTDRNWAQQIERVQKLYREIPQHILSTFPSGMTVRVYIDILHSKFTFIRQPQFSRY